MSQYPYGMPPPAPSDPTDVTWKRVAAWLLDGVIYVILSNVINVVLGTAPKIASHDFNGNNTAASNYCDTWRAANSGFCSYSNGTATTIHNYVPAIWVFVGLFVLYVVVQGLLGASLGKLALNLRIVKADGTTAGIGASAVRTVLWLVDGLTCGLPIIGGIAMFSSKGHRRVGDMAAGTYVVNQHQVGKPVILPGDPGWGTYPPSHPGFGAGQPGGFGPPTGYGQPGGFGPPTGYGPPSGFGPPTGYGQPGGFPQPGATPPSSNPWASAPSADQPTPGPAAPASPIGQGTNSGDYEADVPAWDEARNTYIQYDSARQAWLEFDQASQQWKPIST